MQDSIGPYRVEGEIGRGGMGVVYRAIDTRLDRDVAIKSLPEEVAADAMRLARFEREAKTLASLSHPNLAGIYGVEEQDGARYLVLEFVEGPTLADLLDRGALPIDDAIEYCSQIAAGVEAAHEAGVIHRDLKPANVKITPEGKVKVLDFGLAKADEGASSSSSSGFSEGATLTTPVRHAPSIEGAVMGTAAYMSPEQARGRRVDKRTDIWSLGVLIYECLTGASPFVGETATDSIGAVLHKDVDLEKLPAGTPVRIRDLLVRMLSRDKELRVRDAGDVWLELRTCADELERGVTGAREGRGGSKAPAVVLGVLAVAAAGAAVVGWLPRESAAGDVAARRGLEVASMRRLTFSSGAKGYPNLTPDGGALVYQGLGGDDFDIFYVRAGGLNPQNLTESFTGQESQPAISPDGTRVAFWSDRDGGGVWVMGATGESPRRLTSFGGSPAWSPDGSQIIIATEPNENPLGRTSISSLHIIDVASGQRREFFAGDAVEPNWSPDGNRIAYWALAEGGRRDLFTVEILEDGSAGEPIAVTNDAATDYSPVWSRDGRWIYFSSIRNGSTNLWRIPVEDGAAAGAPEMVTLADASVYDPSFDAAGDRVALVMGRTRNATMRVEIDPESGEATGPATAVIEGQLAFSGPEASPDGSRLLGVIRDNNEDIAVADVDGSNIRLLTSDTAKDRGTSWSADGRRIVFFSDRSGTYQIWSIRPDGSGLTQHTDIASSDEASPWFPHWIAGDTAIVYTSRAGVFRYDPTGPLPVTEPEKIADPYPGGSMFLLDLSPDRRRLVGVSQPPDAPPRLLTFDIETGSYQLIAERSGFVGSWVDDSRMVGVDGRDIVLIDVQTGERTRVYTFEGEGFIGECSYDPVSGAIFFFQSEVESDIWMLELEAP